MEDRRKIINQTNKTYPISKQLAKVDFLLIREGVSKFVHTKTYDYLNIMYHNIKSKMTLTQTNTCVVIDYINTLNQYNIDEIDLKRNLRNFLNAHKSMLILMKKPSQIPDYRDLVLNGCRMDSYFDEKLLNVGFIDITDKFNFNSDINGLNSNYYAFNNNALTKFFNDSDLITIESDKVIKTDTPKGYLTDLIYVANNFSVERYRAPGNKNSNRERKYSYSGINDKHAICDNILDNIVGRHDNFVLSAQTSEEYKCVTSFFTRLANKSTEYDFKFSSLLKVADSIEVPVELLISNAIKNQYAHRILLALSHIPSHDTNTLEKVVSEFEKLVDESLYQPRKNNL